MFTLVLETNGIRQVERKQAQNTLIIVLQILTTEQMSARESPATIKAEYFHDNFEMQL